MSFFDIFRKKLIAEAKKTPGVSASDVEALMQNGIVLHVDEDAGTIPPDATKIGGRPFLPADFAWPVFADGADSDALPLSFLCQINLSEVKAYDRDGVLPDHGMLYFFYECESFRWGFDPADKGCARVLYYEDTAGFVPVELPEALSEEYAVPEMAVRFTAENSYPSYEELDLHSDLDCDWDGYDAALEELGVDPDAEEHKLLGYAKLIQNEMLTECERVSRGIYCGGVSPRPTPEEEERIRRGAGEWTLLLQLTTLQKGDWEWMWGDCGMLYFYIRKEDLAARRFENAWFALQCC